MRSLQVPEHRDVAVLVSGRLLADEPRVLATGGLALLDRPAGLHKGCLLGTVRGVTVVVAAVRQDSVLDTDLMALQGMVCADEQLRA